MMNTKISSSAATCLENFTKIQFSGRLNSHEAEVSDFAWYRELGRLRVRVATTDALQEAQSSLDYRLRNASHVQGQVIRQLSRMQQVLEDLQLALEVPLLEETSDSETEDEESKGGPV